MGQKLRIFPETDIQEPSLNSQVFEPSKVDHSLDLSIIEAWTDKLCQTSESHPTAMTRDLAKIVNNPLLEQFSADSGSSTISPCLPPFPMERYVLQSVQDEAWTPFSISQRVTT